MVNGAMDDEAARNAPEQEAAVDSFKTKLTVADGELIPLSKPGPNGEPLFITSRFFTIHDKRVDIAGTLYDPKSPRITKEEIDGMLFVDIFAQEESGLLPVGRLDWQIAGEEAKDSSKVRDIVQIKTTKEHEEMAKRTFNGEAAFVVRPEFENMGLGTLLLGTSALILHDKGARYFGPTILLRGSVQGAVGKFADADKIPSRDGFAYPKRGRIDKYFESPKFNQVLRDFAPKFA